eukprot:TRINITY_DN4185_c0_g1_i1.p1 TRINITY_DN4185_c0_g1~~TRINITY_DN4185_c0_g1_i1.p1  ORF type:complete len:710 (-),score=69.58 TRINITY_DN4185_c0_g1_i1:324-2453(-)
MPCGFNCVLPLACSCIAIVGAVFFFVFVIRLADLVDGGTSDWKFACSPLIFVAGMAACFMVIDLSLLLRFSCRYHVPSEYITTTINSSIFLFLVIFVIVTWVLFLDGAHVTAFFQPDTAYLILIIAMCLYLCAFVMQEAYRCVAFQMIDERERRFEGWLKILGVCGLLGGITAHRQRLIDMTADSSAWSWQDVFLPLLFGIGIISVFRYVATLGSVFFLLPGVDYLPRQRLHASVHASAVFVLQVCSMAFLGQSARKADGSSLPGWSIAGWLLPYLYPICRASWQCLEFALYQWRAASALRVLFLTLCRLLLLQPAVRSRHNGRNGQQHPRVNQAIAPGPSNASTDGRDSDIKDDPSDYVVGELEDVVGDDTPEYFACAICFDRRISTALVPCGHVATCRACAVQLLHRGAPCPFCRRQINHVVRLFFPTGVSLETLRAPAKLGPPTPAVGGTSESGAEPPDTTADAVPSSAAVSPRSASGTNQNPFSRPRASISLGASPSLTGRMLWARGSVSASELQPPVHAPPALRMRFGSSDSFLSSIAAASTYRVRRPTQTGESVAEYRSRRSFHSQASDSPAHAQRATLPEIDPVQSPTTATECGIADFRSVTESNLLPIQQQQPMAVSPQALPLPILPPPVRPAYPSVGIAGLAGGYVVPGPMRMPSATFSDVTLYHGNDVFTLPAASIFSRQELQTGASPSSGPRNMPLEE